MSDVLETPSVIDLDVLLQPIAGENPAGDSLRYSGIYDEIAEARRADIDINQGEWQTQLKTADYNAVVNIAVNALSTLSKDLQIAAWLGEALIKLHGFAGLRDGLKLMAGLHENFWEGAFPVVEDGDQEGRANAVAWLENAAASAVRSAPLTAGAGYSYNDWVDAKRFDIPANIDSLDSESQQRWSDLKVQAEKENRVTADKWKSALAQTKRAFSEQTQATIAQCWAALEELNSAAEAKYDRNQMPGLSALKKSLGEVEDQSKKILERKRIEEPDAADESVDAADAQDSDETGEVTAGNGAAPGVAGPIRGRPDALKRLEQIAAFFQRTEPHSPVAHLVQRAVKWGNMPLEGWLADVIKDETVLAQLRETLGLSALTGYDSASDNTWDPPSDASETETSSSTSDEW